MDIHYNQPIYHSQSHPKTLSLRPPPALNSETLLPPTKNIPNTQNQKNKKSLDYNHPNSNTPILQLQQLNTIHDSHDNIQKLLKLKLRVSQYNTSEQEYSHSLHNKLSSVKKFHRKMKMKQDEKQKQIMRNSNGRQISIKLAMKNLAGFASYKTINGISSSQYDSVYFQQRILMSSKQKMRIPNYFSQPQKIVQIQHPNIRNTTRTTSRNQVNAIKSKSLVNLQSANKSKTKIKVVLKTNKKVSNRNKKPAADGQIAQNYQQAAQDKTNQNNYLTVQELDKISYKTYEQKMYKPTQFTFRIKKAYNNPKVIKNKHKNFIEKPQQQKDDIIPINAWQDNLLQDNISGINLQRSGRNYQQYMQQAQIQQFVELAAHQHQN